MNTHKKTTAGRLAVAAMALASIAGSVLVGATSADAAYSCTYGYSSVGAYAKCGLPLNTRYRAVVLCQNIFTLSSYNRYGNIVSTNSSTPSTIQGCGAFERYYGQPYAQSL